MKSIRGFLLSRILVGTALVLGAASLGLYVVVTRALERQFDRNLADRVQGFASILFQVENRVMLEFSEELMPEYVAEEAPEYFELRLTDGRLFERSDSLGDADFELDQDPGPEPHFWSAPLPDGRPGRFVSRIVPIHHVRPEEGPNRPTPVEVVIALARGREGLLRAERSVLFGGLGSVVALFAVLGLIVRSAVRRGLAPADRLALALDAVHAEHLPERLETPAMPVELEPMASTSDGLVQRLGAALDRERRTTADIAHELRTPISEMMTVSEVALRAPDTPEPARKALRTMRDVAWRMGRSVSTLLKLARLEMGAERFRSQPLDLMPLLREIRRASGSIERERCLAVRVEIEDDARVQGDEDVLRIILSNLLSNAFYYSPRGGDVVLGLACGDGRWSLSVENQALELRKEDLATLTQPFWRKDQARSDRDRSGLGLGLSRSLAERSGLQLAFELDGGRFRAVLGGPRDAGLATPAPRTSVAAVREVG